MRSKDEVIGMRLQLPESKQANTMSHGTRKGGLGLADAHPYILIGVLAFLGLAIHTVAFYPGFMSADSISQLDQILKLTPYNTWHPLTMIVVWKILLTVTGHVGSMLIFQLSMLWLALGLLAMVAYRKTGRLFVSLLVLAIGFLPFIMNISGVIWADVQMAFALGLAVSVLFYLVSVKVGRLQRWAIMSISVLFLIYAAALRYNALPALIPIFLYTGTLLTKSRIKLGLIVAALIAVSFVLPIAISTALKAEKTSPTLTIMVDDIVHIEGQGGIERTQLHDQEKRAIVADMRTCLPEVWLVNYFWGCLDPASQASMRSEGSLLQSEWVKTIERHPLSYVIYRARAYLYFLHPRNNEQVYAWQFGIDQGAPLGLTTQYTLAERTNHQYTDFFVKDFGFVYRPYFWLTLSTVMLVTTFRQWRHSKYRDTIRVLAASSVAYILFYIPIVGAADYRYIYWSVYATLLCLVIRLIETNMSEIRRGSR